MKHLALLLLIGGLLAQPIFFIGEAIDRRELSRQGQYDRLSRELDAQTDAVIDLMSVGFSEPKTPASRRCSQW